MQILKRLKNSRMKKKKKVVLSRDVLFEEKKSSESGTEEKLDTAVEGKMVRFTEDTKLDDRKDYFVALSSDQEDITGDNENQNLNLLSDDDED